MLSSGSASLCSRFLSKQDSHVLDSSSLKTRVPHCDIDFVHKNSLVSFWLAYMVFALHVLRCQKYIIASIYSIAGLLWSSCPRLYIGGGMLSFRASCCLRTAARISFRNTFIFANILSPVSASCCTLDPVALRASNALRVCCMDRTCASNASFLSLEVANLDAIFELIIRALQLHANEIASNWQTCLPDGHFFIN